MYAQIKAGARQAISERTPKGNAQMGESGDDPNAA